MSNLWGEPFWCVVVAYSDRRDEFINSLLDNRFEIEPEFVNIGAFEVAREVVIKKKRAHVTKVGLCVVGN